MLILILVAQLFLLNGIYLFLCLICLFIGIRFLQQPYKSSVFTFIFFYHFLQIIAGVWQANDLETNIDFRSPNMGYATLISLAGLLLMFLPIIYFQNKIPPINIQILRNHADKLSINKTFYAYVIAFFVMSFSLQLQIVSCKAMEKIIDKEQNMSINL